MECLEKDWKLYRKKIADWQENYIAKRIEAYKEILNSNQLPSSKFWKLDEIIKKDKNNPGVIIKDQKRSNLYFIMLNLINYKVITFDDLEEFSDELKDSIKRAIKR